ncbi:hypothetical protein [Cellulomonas fengjieae]|uniref:Uncharacterized protein n=1 Tax=Cellulomonas fengjieae TaxID=2819978 RepID=A0ABS3SJX4_9CELL|nr:hypothetical protein [Cellulomonas fengjieae]MBO3086051.1 hypothetical protein [Cellulomonas fengjieae]QVI65880.1 hypothetical protein KG102_17705 [Cellulomonas fengjieae]
MRAIRGKIAVVAALVLALALALTALVGLGGQPQQEPQDGPWAIQLTDPAGDWASCFDDPLVTPPTTSGSTVTAVFVAEATEADVDRVTDCLADVMTGGSIQVGTVAPAGA